MKLLHQIISYFIIILLFILYIYKPKLVSNILNITLGRLLAILAILYLSYTNILFGLIFTLSIIIIMSIKN